ncbi:hypothetical protein H5410_062078 [Solanum commersonii]|uniref:Uncharacterized protein n=1 Tax=Solanum commersonii TaxID=4109 RepID=A0A9J5WB60_SOLCO|nr:hypothetical protein H5410_062078 [Solanum commersonii]
MKEHTRGSGLSCAKEIHFLSFDVFTCLPFLFQHKTELPRRGFLIDHKPEDVAATIQLLNQTVPDSRRQNFMVELQKLAADWPLEVIKRQKDERKKVLVQLQRLKVLKNPSESEREKRKGKGKVVESTPKREDRKYVTRGTAQKLLGDAMVANKAQTIRNRRERKTDILPVENPIVLTQDARSSDTESEDIVRAVAKWQKEAEEQRVKAQRTTRSSNKSPAKRARVNTRAVSKPKPVKGPGPAAKGKDEDKVLTREEELQNSRSRSWEHLFECAVPYLHEPEVREFYYNMDLLDDGGFRTTVWEVEITLSEESLGIILGVPFEGIWSVEGCKPSLEYV